MATIEARRRDGSRMTLDPTGLATLRTGLRGSLLLEGEAGYDEARTIWNAMIDRRPALIARCLGVADILAGLRFAREHELALSIKAGGHNIAGLAVTDGGLMLDLSLMRGVWVDPAARRARAQPGCLLGDVDRETQLHGLADRARLRFRHGSRRPDPGRWIRLHDPPLRLDQRQRAVDGRRDRRRAARARERDGERRPLLGPARRRRQLRGGHGHRLRAPPHRLLDGTQPRGRRYYWKSEYLPGIEKDMLAKMREHAGRITSPHSAVIVFAVDGALNRRPADHSAVGNRDAAVVLNITASWENPQDDAVHVEWARSAWRDMRRFSTGGTYVKFLTEEEGGDRIEAAYGDNFARLVEVKRAWDPENVFRMNKNIAPRG